MEVEAGVLGLQEVAEAGPGRGFSSPMPSCPWSLSTWRKGREGKRGHSYIAFSSWHLAL